MFLCGALLSAKICEQVIFILRSVAPSFCYILFVLNSYVCLGFLTNKKECVPVFHVQVPPTIAVNSSPWVFLAGMLQSCVVWFGCKKKSTQRAPGNTCQDKWTNRRLDWVTCFFQQKSIRQTFHQFLNYVLFWHFFTFAYLCCLLVPPVTWANKSWRKMASECLIEGTSCKNPPSPKSKWLTHPHTLKKI